MKNASECAKRLDTLLKGLASDAKEPNFSSAHPIDALVMSFLLWECTTDKARTAYGNLSGRVVDFNDLRVCMPEETLRAIGFGGRYPRGLDRCQRLRAVLRDIYQREHAVSLDGIVEQGKREIRRYLDSLEGMVPYVAARVSLLCFDVHAIPVDEQLRTCLTTAGIIDEAVELSELGSWLERHIKASDGPSVHFALQSWADSGGSDAKSRSRKRTKSNRKSGASRSKTGQKTGTKRSMSRT